jgi:anti-sigma regulatory factor (Ser/Thr protein kinase)
MMTSQHPHRDRRWTVLLLDRRHGGRATADGQTWPLRSHLELAAHPGAVPDARHHTRRVLAGWDLGALGEAAELIVSELVTNAIRACQAPGTHRQVQLRLASDRARLLIEVQDCSPQRPVPAGATDDDESRRGLCLVEAVSAAWGWYPDPASGGKVVWALLPATADGRPPARAAVRHPRPAECAAQAAQRSGRFCPARRLGSIVPPAGAGVGAGGAELQVPAGRHAECCSERPGEVGLVGEAGLECGLGQRPGVAQPASGHIEAPHHRVPVRAGPVDGMELARELIAV